jgi:type II secretory pathway pseudopilin PulG
VFDFVLQPETLFMDQNVPPVPPVPAGPRVSSMAITSLVLGVASFMCWIFTGLPAVVLGALSLRKIYRSQGQLTGEGLAIGGIVTGAVTTFLVLPIMIALLLPAVQAAREAARRAQSMNNMKQITLGMLNYADSHGTFPASGGGAGRGEPGSKLSWRVRILPMIEQQALYEQFHLDEPWNSEHNRTLLAKMPDVFKSPNGNFPEGYTSYLAVTGPETVFDDRDVGRGFRDIADGTSRTIVLVEADRGVEWTKPEDWPSDPNVEAQGLGKLRPRGFLAAFADGSVRFIPDDTDPQVVRALMTRAGRENIVAP